MKDLTSITWISLGAAAFLCSALRLTAQATAVPTEVSPLDKPKQKTYVNSLGMKFVEVPGTEVMFCIWETRKQDYKAFWNAELRVEFRPISWSNTDFVQDDSHPVVNVSWYDAKEFCDWLSLKEGRTYRLPTDAEWSVAVAVGPESGSTPKERNNKRQGVYPWGTQWPPPNDAGNYADYGSEKIPGFRDGHEYTAPVGSFRANKLGLFDLGGNVSEWCEDLFDAEWEEHVVRGGSWDSHSPGSALSSRRLPYMPDRRYSWNGFRVVLVVGD
ncbi:MAG: SUMF1/EgtB/PvdO family nonheme iron enzyme [Verrucomicrobiales bacterium]|nr:SUMF1/EgtB/PvdO family nonheme iron enzyme [Verrucomicrobiales bacterium]